MTRDVAPSAVVPPAVGPLLSVRDVAVHFPVRRGLFGRTVGRVRAVDGVSLDVFPGETLGLVGESGCGKTTLGRAALALVRPTRGTVTFAGLPVWAPAEGEARSEPVRYARVPPDEMRAARRRMQIVFQDPYGSLNPRMTVEAMVGEGLAIHGLVKDARGRRERTAALLERVGLSTEALDRYPHEFSGGQRQRIAVARALSVGPDFVVCDEPVSALDVSVQAQIVNLLLDLQDEMGLSYLLISHDLNLVTHVARRVAVMYLGEIVELAGAGELRERACHPYTEALYSAVPEMRVSAAGERGRIVLSGEPPSPMRPPSGCRFHPRCPKAFERCPKERPPLYDLGRGRLAACFLVEKEARGPSGPVAA